MNTPTVVVELTQAIQQDPGSKYPVPLISGRALIVRVYLKAKGKTFALNDVTCRIDRVGGPPLGAVAVRGKLATYNVRTVINRLDRDSGFVFVINGERVKGDFTMSVEVTDAAGGQWKLDVPVAVAIEGRPVAIALVPVTADKMIGMSGKVDATPHAPDPAFLDELQLAALVLPVTDLRITEAKGVSLVVNAGSDLDDVLDALKIIAPQYPQNVFVVGRLSKSLLGHGATEAELLPYAGLARLNSVPGKLAVYVEDAWPVAAHEIGHLIGGRHYDSNKGFIEAVGAYLIGTPLELVTLDPKRTLEYTTIEATKAYTSEAKATGAVADVKPPVWTSATNFLAIAQHHAFGGAKAPPKGYLSITGTMQPGGLLDRPKALYRVMMAEQAVTSTTSNPIAFEFHRPDGGFLGDSAVSPSGSPDEAVSAVSVGGYVQYIPIPETVGETLDTVVIKQPGAADIVVTVAPPTPNRVQFDLADGYEGRVSIRWSTQEALPVIVRYSADNGANWVPAYFGSTGWPDPLDLDISRMQGGEICRLQVVHGDGSPPVDSDGFTVPQPNPRPFISSPREPVDLEAGAVLRLAAGVDVGGVDASTIQSEDLIWSVSSSNHAQHVIGSGSEWYVSADQLETGFNNVSLQLRLEASLISGGEVTVNVLPTPGGP